MRATKHSDAQRTFSISFLFVISKRSGSLAEVERYDFLGPKEEEGKQWAKKTHKKTFYKNMEP